MLRVLSQSSICAAGDMHIPILHVCMRQGNITLNVKTVLSQ